MRINKYLAERLGISRRKADEFLLVHDVTVNGMLAQQGQDITNTDTVLVDGRPMGDKKELFYILLNKPVGYVCSRDGQGSKTIYDLIPSQYRNLNPVGRLDKDSSGLLLLTNDGKLHQQLTHPSHQKEKVYQVTLNTALANTDKTRIEHGVTLADGISALKLNAADNTGIRWQITMHEGRNRQIRRTFEALGYEIKKLHRTEFGDYKLNDISSGSFVLV